MLTHLRSRTGRANLVSGMKARSQPSLVRAIRALRTQAQTRPTTHPRVPVRALIVYREIACARQSLAHLTAMLQRSRRDAELHPMLWRVDQLDDPRWRELALRDASRAEMVVLALLDEAALCAKTEAWLETLRLTMKGQELHVLALVGTDEAWSITLAAPQAERARLEPKSASVEALLVPPPKCLAACAA